MLVLCGRDAPKFPCIARGARLLSDCLCLSYFSEAEGGNNKKSLHGSMQTFLYLQERLFELRDKTLSQGYHFMDAVLRQVTFFELSQ